MARQLSAKAILPDQISLEHCDWYSDDAPAGHNTGALKLPRGNTAERPTTATGGRENIEIIGTVSQPDVFSSDPSFNMADPWIWSWSGNYNRNELPATTFASGTTLTGLTLLRGSKYRFKNATVGHAMWLRSAPKTDNATANNIYALGTAEGVTGNGAIKAQIADESAEIQFEIPADYAPNVVYVQHSQTGMVNTIAISDPPAETLGYIRVNTDIGHDEGTQTGLEVYTGAGWKTIPYSDNAGGTKTHPTGTLLTDDNGNVATSTASTSDNASIATAVASTEDLGQLLITAFLADGDLSATVSGVGATKTLVLHDGATGGGVSMLRADMANAPIKKTNKSIQYLKDENGVTYQDTNLGGSLSSRIAFTEEATGHDVFTLEDSGKKLRVSGNINTNTWFKITFDAYTNTSQTAIDFRKNGVTERHRWMTTTSAHHSFTAFIKMSFNDILEVHANSAGTQQTAYLSDKHMLIELIGS